jgi:spermidine/putrescine transport system permease protein
MATQAQERRLAFLATAVPPIAWIVVFFLAPLAIVWAYSFGQNAGLTDV